MFYLMEQKKKKILMKLQKKIILVMEALINQKEEKFLVEQAP